MKKYTPIYISHKGVCEISPYPKDKYFVQKYNQ